MPVVAYRAVRSRRKFDKAPQIIKHLEATLDNEVKPLLIKRFDLIVKNWKHKPKFKARKYIRPDSIRVAVYPAGTRENVQIYKWVTKGTRGPYPIPKAGPGYLAFQLGYKPKTRPVGQFGGPGKATGEKIKGVMQVSHPGIEARKFEESVKNDAKKWYSRTMENAWRRAIRRA